jgi:hypothetical protein
MPGRWAQVFQTLIMSENQIVFYQNPKVDFLFGLLGHQIPTKQDKFKPLENGNVYIKNEDGSEILLDEIYKKNPETRSINEFSSVVKDIAKNIFSVERMFRRPTEIEIILSITFWKE